MTENWEKITLLPDTSIKNVLQVIDDNAIRVALVVNEEFDLLGVVSDGDIRREILNLV